MKSALISCMIIVVAMLLLTCSGSPEVVSPNPTIPNPNPGTGPILELTDEQRIVVLDECSAIARTLGDLKDEASQQILVAWLTARREFESAGISRGNVWANFHDGRPLMIVPDWKDKDSYNGRKAAPDVKGGRAETENISRTGGMPAGKKVMLFHGLGTAFDDNRPELEKIFLKAPQYKVESKLATIEELRKAKDVDIFFIDTHAGNAVIRPVAEGIEIFGLWTRDLVTQENERRYKLELDQAELGYMIALESRGPGNTDIDEKHYAITLRFVEEHMSFGENSLIYIDACNSLSDAGYSFWKTVMTKAKHKATYIGWDNLSNQGVGIPTSHFVFDRLLGAQAFMPETPVQRPFDLEPIFSDFSRYNLGITESGGRLVYEIEPKGSKVLLRPTIEYIIIDEHESKMHIYGLFGDPPYTDADASVTVDGFAAHTDPTKWAPTHIVCDLPTTGRGSIGSVVVTVRGNQSNAVPITEWIIPLSLTKVDMGLKLEVNLELRVRADVHPYRTKPGEQPRKERPDEMFPGPEGAGHHPFAIGSTGNFVFGGQRGGECKIAACDIMDIERAKGKSGVLPFSARASRRVRFWREL